MPESKDGKSETAEKPVEEKDGNNDKSPEQKVSTGKGTKREDVSKRQKERWAEFKEYEAKKKQEKEKQEKEKSNPPASFSGKPAETPEKKEPEKPKDDSFAIAMVAISVIAIIAIGIWLLSKYLNNRDEQEYEEAVA